VLSVVPPASAPKGREITMHLMGGVTRAIWSLLQGSSEGRYGSPGVETLGPP
jgi:hypothetical protein